MPIRPGHRSLPQLPETITDRLVSWPSDSPWAVKRLRHGGRRRGVCPLDHHLQRRYRRPADNQDVVDYVLFESQEGYCEYYASDGRPAPRGGHPITGRRRLLPGPVRPERGRAPLPGKNAHLWVEASSPVTAGSRSSQPQTGNGSITVISPRPRRRPPFPHPSRHRPSSPEPTPPPIAETPPQQPHDAALTSCPTRHGSRLDRTRSAALVAVASLPPSPPGLRVPAVSRLSRVSTPAPCGWATCSACRRGSHYTA